MSDLLWPLLLSVRIAVAATALVTLAAVPLAFALARRAVPGRSLVEAAVLVPLVLPPTVVGYFILVAAGARSTLGGWLASALDYRLIFHWHGAVLASAVVALPLLYLPARAAFAAVDRHLEDVARLDGANLLQVFWHVSLPLARRGIASGMLLAFARALGEFGATVMVLGILPGRQTLPITIYAHYEAGELERATGAVTLLTAVSLVIVWAYNRSSLARRE